MQKKSVQKELSTGWLAPLLVILAIVPLIVVLGVYETDLSTYSWGAGVGSGKKLEFFLVTKANVLMIAGLVLTGVFAYFLGTKQTSNLQRKDSYIVWIPAVIYAFFTIASVAMAQNVDTALWGGFEQFEGALTMLCYVLSFLFVYAYVSTEKWLDIIFKFLIVSILIVSVLGVYQTFGMDYILSDWYRGILTMLVDGANLSNITLSFGENVAYSTLYNPDYIGSYVALLLPLTAVLAFFSKGITWKVLSALAFVCQMIMMYGSRAVAGYVGIVAAVCVAIFFFLPHIKDKMIISVGLGIAIVGVVAGVLFVKPDLVTRFFSDNAMESTEVVTGIVTKKDTFVLTMKSGKKAVGKISTGGLLLQKENGESLPTEGNISDTTTPLRITEAGYEGVSFVYDAEQKVICVQASGSSWRFGLKNGKVKFANANGRLVDLKEIEAIGFEDNYGFANKRGYLWSRTLPLLDDTLLLGVGADNFVYAFPNDDYIGKDNWEFDNQIVTKPHNIFMQVWIQNGMFACLAMIFLYGYFVFDTIRKCFRKGKLQKLEFLSIAILAGTTGFMVVGLVNDSLVGITSTYWILLGLGYAINIMIGKNGNPSISTEKSEIK